MSSVACPLGAAAALRPVGERYASVGLALSLRPEIGPDPPRLSLIRRSRRQLRRRSQWPHQGSGRSRGRTRGRGARSGRPRLRPWSPARTRPAGSQGGPILSAQRAGSTGDARSSPRPPRPDGSGERDAARCAAVPLRTGRLPAISGIRAFGVGAGVVGVLGGWCAAPALLRRGDSGHHGCLSLGLGYLGHAGPRWHPARPGVPRAAWASRTPGRCGAGQAQWGPDGWCASAVSSPARASRPGAGWGFGGGG